MYPVTAAMIAPPIVSFIPTDTAQASLHYAATVVKSLSNDPIVLHPTTEMMGDLRGGQGYIGPCKNCQSRKWHSCEFAH